MELSLFSREYIHTDLSYQENLKLNSLFESVFSKEISDLIFEMFSMYGDESEIRGRIDFFREITENNQSREFLKTIRRIYKNIENGVILYERAVGQRDKAIWGFNLLKQYVDFVDEAVACKPDVNSLILNQLYNSFVQASASEDYLNLCNRLKDTEKSFEEIKAMNIYGNYVSTTLMYCGFETGYKENVCNKIKSYLGEMGFDVDLWQQPKASDTDLYKKYISYIVSKYPDADVSLQNICNQFESVIKDITETDIKDIKIALSCCELYDFLKGKNIPLCYPEITSSDKMILDNIYDISLLTQKADIVSNKAEFSENEKVVFISGANGGGKTSFIRAIGICNVMGSCGLFVPAKAATLSVRDNIFTVFPHQEQLSMEGRFVTEKSFLKTAVEQATCKSLVIANELFSTTDETTALKQYQYFTCELENKNSRVLFVTHFTNVVKFYSGKDYPLYSCKMENDSVTYKVERSVDRSSSVALLLKKYRLEKSQLKERRNTDA